MEESRPDIAPTDPRGRSLKPLYVCVLVATAFVLPICVLGNPSGHDLQPHLASWMDIHSQWREGILFPRWAEWSNFGFGEPRFIFYPPLSPLLGAALGSVLPWRMVPGVILGICFFLATFSMYKLASDWLESRQALIAAVLFAANPYNIILAYYRGAFAELLAAALFPLLIWAVLGVMRGEWRRAPLLALVFAVIWLTNTPAAVIATYTIVVVLIVSAVLRSGTRPIVTATACMTLGFGLAAFYVWPVWRERGWIDMAAIVLGDGNPERNFLFSTNNLSDFLAFNWIVSAIGIYLMAATAVALVFEWPRGRRRADVFWTLTVLAVVSSVMMLPLSKLLWRHLPGLVFLQFPWRWLTVLALAFAAVVASVIKFRSKTFWVAAVITCAAVLTLSLKVGWGGHDVAVMTQKFVSGNGYFSTTNFTPVGANRFTLEEHAPLLQRVDDKGELTELRDVTAQVGEWSTERKHFWVQAKEEVTVAVKLLNYPAWQVLVDEQTAKVDSFRKNGQMLITLPEGKHGIDIRFRRTRDRTIGGVISGASLIVLLAITVALWRGRFRSASLA